MPFTTVADRAQAQRTIRGSRFLAVVASVADPDEAQRLVEEARALHPDASHHCSAWRVGAQMAADDDGEPGGTAGRPMLEVLLKRDLDRVGAVCVRWFGGTKLGAGGLVRAYGGTVAQALDLAGEVIVHETVTARVFAPYPRVDVLHRLLDGWPELRKGEPVYAPSGVHIPVTLRADRSGELSEAIADATAGDAEVTLDERPERTDS
ncbi:MAG: YigZ family protein [Trueperaceae bacterium]|nr:YigZ family protein [Trueperaceae bacterium]